MSVKQEATENLIASDSIFKGEPETDSTQDPSAAEQE